MIKHETAQNLEDAIKLDCFVFEGKHSNITAIKRSDILLVTFDNLASINERPKGGPWQPWLHGRAEALGYSILGMQSHNKDWYRTPDAAEQIKALRKLGYFEQFSRVLFVGASMGGFAALCFAHLVPKACVLAFSPQSTLNRDIAPFERRYPWPYRKFDWDTPTYLDAAEHVEGIAGGHIFYDPHVGEDAQHVQRLSTSNIKNVKIPFSGHTLIRTIAKSGALEVLLKELAESGELGTAFWRKMRNRRKDPRWAKSFLHVASARRDASLARQACDLMWAEYQYPFARRIRKRIEQRTLPRA